MRRGLGVLAVGLAVFGVSAGKARADITISADPLDGTIEGRANVNGVIYTSGGGGGPRCTWTRLTVGQVEDLPGVFAAPRPTRPTPLEPLDPAVELTEEEAQARADAEAEFAVAEAAVEADDVRRAQLWVVGEVAGVSEPHGAFGVDCPSGIVGSGLRITPLNVDVDDLIPGAEAVARGRIELPVPNVNPTANNGGFVNLGMWLAVEPATVEPITAEAGPTAWITISPAHQSISFDFGNGDVVTCPNFGDPIEQSHPDLDVKEQSELCGYTYRQSSPEDDPYQLTTTTTWHLPYTSSDGAGSLDAFGRSITEAYDVDEIQTVGRDN